MQDKQIHNEEQPPSTPTPETTIYLTYANHAGQVKSALEDQLTIHSDDTENRVMKNSNSQTQTQQSTTSAASTPSSYPSPEHPPSAIPLQSNKTRERILLARMLKSKRDGDMRIVNGVTNIFSVTLNAMKDNIFDDKTFDAWMKILQEVISIIPTEEWEQVVREYEDLGVVVVYYT